MPPKIDKTHGFMKSIIQNQVSRDEYDKQQRLSQESEGTKSAPTKQLTARTRTPPKRPAIQLYVPPRVRDRTNDERMEHSPSPELTKRVAENNPEKNYQKRTRKAAAMMQDGNSKVLFKFEFEDDEGNVKSIDVLEDDNAEDLAEIFGSQLGLTKQLKNALKHRLNQEMNKCKNTL